MNSGEEKKTRDDGVARKPPPPPIRGFDGLPVTEDEKLPAVARAAPPAAAVKVKPTKPTYIKAPEGYTPRFSRDKDHLIEIGLDDIADEDVLCGRVNKGSTHPGNVEFLRIIKFHRIDYQGMGAQHGKKTKLRNKIVDKEFQGRFIGVDEDGTHYLLTEGKARTKVSQALREKSKQDPFVARVESIVDHHGAVSDEEPPSDCDCMSLASAEFNSDVDKELSGNVSDEEMCSTKVETNPSNIVQAKRPRG